MSNKEEEFIAEIRKPTEFGAKRLKYYFDLDWPEGSIYRYLKENDYYLSHKNKGNLKKIKTKYKASERIMVDIKNRQDIPNYRP